MYHEVPPAGDPIPYFGVARPRFAAQLDALATIGRPASTLEAVLAEPGVAATAVTFDDGHETHYRHAFPELRARRMRATFFVVTDRVGAPGYVTWDQLREMAADGMSIQSHTASHPYLSELDKSAVLEELQRSRARLDVELQQRTTTLALPGGDAPRRWSAVDYSRAGYAWVATSAWGPNRAPMTATDPFVRRYTVRRDTPDALFRQLAEGRHGAYSAEGLRLRALSELRAALGASRYARLRRATLAFIGR
jgi:peptidoglycan/xylan/chitin deacetylase (PgdA/CDA1 family)